MGICLSDTLVIGISSSALFDLEESDQVFRNDGEEAYRKHQKQNAQVPFKKGVAFAFIKSLLALNEHREAPIVEVILLSRNDAHTGSRAFYTIEYFGLPITRAAFLQGGTPYEYIGPFQCDLFLSANDKDVKKAIEAGYPAGCVISGEKELAPIDEDKELKIAFDFDGVLADDEAESVFAKKGLDEFNHHEVSKADIPHNPGPLEPFLKALAHIQSLEQSLEEQIPEYKSKIRVSIVTARGAPAHQRVINTLENWGVTVNESFFLGGIEKTTVLNQLRPHIFFDDQIGHISKTKLKTPSVHVPFGVKNL